MALIYNIYCKDYKVDSALNNILSNDEYGIKEAIIFNNENLEIVDNKTYMPVYMSMFLEEDGLSDSIVKVNLNL